MYAQEARAFILKLVHIQKAMRRKNFIRADYAAVSTSISELEKYLGYFKLETDDKMRGFWDRNLQHIRALIPGQNYPGFRKIMDEYMVLKNQ